MILFIKNRLSFNLLTLPRLKIDSQQILSFTFGGWDGINCLSSNEVTKSEIADLYLQDVSCIVRGASTALGVDGASIADDNAGLELVGVDQQPSLLASAVVTINAKDDGRIVAPRLTSQVYKGLLGFVTTIDQALR